MSISDYLSGIMHAGSQIMQIPTIGCLIVLTLLVSFCVGWLVVEFFAERRHFKINHVETIARMRASDFSSIGDIIRESALLADQKKRLLVVVDNMGLRDDELYALAQIEIAKGERMYKRRVNLTDMISKIGPMLGLMGTLIPLGPGIVAMGQGKVEILSQSLLIAFDTTILGLVSAVVAMVISRFRKTWYGQYSTVMRSLFMCILDEAEAAREKGVQLPFQAEGHTRKDLERAREQAAGRDTALRNGHVSGGNAASLHDYAAQGAMIASGPVQDAMAASTAMQARDAQGAVDFQPPEVGAFAAPFGAEGRA